MGMAGQMIGVILIGALLATWLSNRFAIGQLAYALIILAFVFLAIGSVLRQLLMENGDEK